MSIPTLEGNTGEGGAWNFEESGNALVRGFSLADGKGIGGTKALKYKRTDPEEYSFQILDSFRPATGAYQLRGSTLVEKWELVRSVLQNRLEGPKVFAQYYLRAADGTEIFGGGLFLNGSNKPGKWAEVQGTLLLPSNATKVEVGVAMPRSHIGTVFFDQIKLTPSESEPELTATFLHPRSGRQPLGGDDLAIALIVKGRTEQQLRNLQLRWTVSQEGMEPVNEELKWSPRIKGHMAGLNPSLPANVRVSLINPEAENKVLATQNLRLEPAAAKKPAYPAVTLDSRGRTLVDGKPFLPIGIYSGGRDDMSMSEFGDVFRPDAIQRISTIFNTVLPYTLLTRYDKSGSKNPLPPSVVRQNLDLLARYNLKCIVTLKDFNEWATEEERARHGWADVTEWNGAKGVEQITRKVVGLFRDHPAVFAWYIHDEGPLPIIPAAAIRAKVVREMDPWRPTYGVFCNSPQLPEMIHLQDVVGMDPYPVQYSSDRGIEMVDRETLNAEAIGAPRWDVPQMFSWGKYAYELHQSDPAKYLRKYRAPTEVETRSITLLQAIRGARGFIFYNYSGLLFEIPEAGETFDKRWAEAERITQMLRDLEPFLLSDLEPYQVRVRERSGRVVARGFQDGQGNHRILIVGVSPGKNEAEIEVPAGTTFSPSYGLCTPGQKPNSWVFKGTDACSEILIGSVQKDAPLAESTSVE